jgi:hypothetical protein
VAVMEDTLRDLRDDLAREKPGLLA